MILMSFGVFGPLPIASSLQVAPGSVQGIRAVWQGAALDANGQLLLSNPSLTLLP